MESARTLLTLGDKEYGNAIGICIIHAVISAKAAEIHSLTLPSFELSAPPFPDVP
jgi:hypothetical protein